MTFEFFLFLFKIQLNWAFIFKKTILRKDFAEVHTWDENLVKQLLVKLIKATNRSKILKELQFPDVNICVSWNFNIFANAFVYLMYTTYKLIKTALLHNDIWWFYYYFFFLILNPGQLHLSKHNIYKSDDLY